MKNLYMVLLTYSCARKYNGNDKFVYGAILTYSHAEKYSGNDKFIHGASDIFICKKIQWE